MGWSTDLYDASFRGVDFDCTSINDAYTKAIAIHQAPYSDDADIEDMGADPRKITVQAVYSGDDYLSWLNALEAVLKLRGSGELIHPIYGILQVQVSSWQVHHDAENPDYGSITIEFLKAKADKSPLFIPIKAQKVDYKQALERPALALEDELKELKRNDVPAYLSAIQKIRNGLKTAYKTLNTTKKSLDQALSPMDWAVGLVDDMTRLVTFDVTDISAMAKWRSLSDRIKRLSTIFIDDDSKNLGQLWAATVVTSQVAIVQEIVNQTNAELSRSNEYSTNDSMLTPTEFAVMRQKVRKDLQSIIQQERRNNNINSSYQIQCFKSYADQVHQQIQQLIETRPPLTKYVIDQPCTVHFLAHLLYEDFERSSEILRLNPDLENPALLLVGQELSIYAR